MGVVAIARATAAAAPPATRTVRVLVLVTVVVAVLLRGRGVVIGVVGIVPVVGLVLDLDDLGEFGLRHLEDQAAVVGHCRGRAGFGCGSGRSGRGKGVARVEARRSLRSRRLVIGVVGISVVAGIGIIVIAVVIRVSADELFEDESPIGHGVAC